MTPLALTLLALAPAADPLPDKPLPVPLTRPEMKQALEDLKDRTPRFPLPDLTAADRAALGERANNYEARLRYHYLPGGTAGGIGLGLGPKDADPNMTLSYAFKVKLFWIVSRTNNCLY